MKTLEEREDEYLEAKIIVMSTVSPESQIKIEKLLKLAELLGEMRELNKDMLRR